MRDVMMGMRSYEHRYSSDDHQHNDSRPVHDAPDAGQREGGFFGFSF